MQPRLNFVTLAAADLAASRRFYVDGLGWPVRFAGEEVLMLDVGPMLVLSLWRRDAFEAEAGDVGAGAAPITLAHNLDSPAGVDAAVAAAVAAGGVLHRAPESRAWGGYSGYVLDPDGYRWEIAWNPDFVVGEG
ncbi:VOC family protein [Nocardioides sp.]|uniref:VOC family protein n=1 Tax=Nocardioides sp. TaxID=35761 RepID=UPI0035110171